MKADQALEAIRQVGTVRAAEGKLKLAFPARMRTSLQPALEVLKANRTEALALVLGGPPPGSREEHWQNWDGWKAAALNRLFQQQGVLGKPGEITAATVRHGRLAPRPCTICAPPPKDQSKQENN
jgi:hypothetical protein